MLIYLAPLVAIAGLLMYALAANPKLARIGEIMFFCGLLVSLMTLSGGSFRLLH